MKSRVSARINSHKLGMYYKVNIIEIKVPDVFGLYGRAIA